MFGSKKYREIIEQQKSMIAEMEVKVTQQNELYRALYELIGTGLSLSKDSKMKDYVREGYEGNPDVFSIVLKLAPMFATIMDNAKLMQQQKNKWVEVENDEWEKLKEKTNYYQNFFEFCQEWAVFRYITGNSIVYTPRLTSGLNKGKLDQDGLLMMPTQDVTIKSGGWRQPIGHYTIDINETYKIDPVNIWHERFAPTLNYQGGRNFMGMSPVKVAQNIINSQNAGYEVTAKMYKFGHPPGILSKEVPEEGASSELTSEQESKFRERYRAKYQGIDNVTVPIFTLGKIAYTKIGYDNLQELQVVNMSEHGRRIFCNILQVPSQLFNDTASSTYNNMTLAEKAIYTNRLMPDVNQFCAGFNNILRAYGDLWLKPDYSDIECLQEEKAKKVEWISKLFNDGIITGDQYLEMIGEEPTGLPEMNVRYVNANRIPIDLNESSDIDNSDKWYKKLGLVNVM